LSAFNYRALDAQGVEHAGLLDADSSQAAGAVLRARGLFALEIAPAGTTAAREGSGALSARWPFLAQHLRHSELTLLTRLWSALLVSGLTMEQSLSALIDQARRGAVRDVLAGVRADIVAGYSLRIALDRYPESFPMIYRASVAAGEKSGEMMDVMSHLADYIESRAALRQKTLQALLYPAIVAVVAGLVAIALMTFVVPQVVGVFAQSKQTLPGLTRALIAVSGFLRDYGGLLALLLVGGLVALRTALRERHFKHQWDARLLKLPGLGNYLASLDAARFASTLAILVGSGVPLLAALDAGRQVVSRLPTQAAINDAAERVREGASLSKALAQTRAFPPLLVHMTANGEATGKLQSALDRAARLLQAELEQRTALFSTLLEPLLLLFMGGMVLLIVIAVMQPIIDINTLIR
jgi:general secretion pathway protein F